MFTQNLHSDASSSFIYNCKNRDTIKVSFRRWMDKSTRYTQTLRYYSALNKNCTCKPWKGIEEISMYTTKWKKAIWKVYIICDCKYMVLWKMQKCESIQILMIVRGLVGEKDQVCKVIFLLWKIFYRIYFCCYFEIVLF